MPSYYYLGHFSKFITPGARCVSTSSSKSLLESTSWMNPNGEMITIIMNMSNDKLEYSFYVGDKEFNLTINSRAIQTLIY